MTLFKSFTICFVIVCVGATWKPTVYQKIRQSSKLSYFFSLLSTNRSAKINLQYGEMTIFVPTNEAFEWYSGSNLHEVLDYHMIWYARQLKDFNSGLISTVIEDYPPIWITKLEDDAYVNNARIIPELSDYLSEINNKPKKPQVLHVIDEVLDPIVKRNTQVMKKPMAYEFLSYPQFWDVGYKYELFGRKVLGSRKENSYKAEGNFTFFIPIDDGFTDYRLQMLDDNAISGHIVPNRVLFTRPSAKDMPFETIANDDYLYVVVVFSQSDGKLYVKSHTLIGDSNHPAGEIVAEIVKPNIPVKNGVIHLIKRPLVVFDRRLTLFPYLPLIDKFSGDPSLNLSYNLAHRYGFTLLLKDETKKFTFFVPRNKAWTNLESFLEVNRTQLDSFVKKYGRAILGRHVVMSNVSYRMEDLKKSFNSADTVANIDLPTLSGTLKIGIGEKDGKYVIYWRNQILPVYRANYFCTNGIVHVVDNFFLNEEDFGVDESQEKSTDNTFHLLNMLIHVTL